MNTLKKIMLISVCAFGLSSGLKAQTNTNFMFVSWWQMTNYFNAVITTGVGTNNLTNQNILVFGGGLLATTNTSVLYTNTNSLPITVVYNISGTNYTNVITNTIVTTNYQTQITASTNGQPILVANGGTGVSTLTNLVSLVGTNMTVSNNAYFNSTSISDTNIASVQGIAPIYPGQLLMTYGSFGGSTAGQLFFSQGASGGSVWRRDMSFGHLTSFMSNSAGAGEVILAKGGVGSGLNGMFTAENLDSNFFSSYRWMDSTASQRGSLGFGNPNAGFYRGINFLDDASSANGFYFTGNGSVMGGLEKTTGDLVWYSGTSSSSNNPFIGLTPILRVQRSTGIISGNGAGLTNVNISQAGLSNIAQNTYLISPINVQSNQNGVGTMQVNIIGTPGTNVGFLNAPLVVIANNGSDHVVGLQNTDPHQFTAINFVSDDTTIGAIGCGNSLSGIYPDTMFIEDDSAAKNGVWFVDGFGNVLCGGLYHRNFVWTTGTTQGTNGVSITTMITPSGTIITHNIGLTNTTTNLPSSTTSPKYYLTVTNNGVSGSIPVYQ